MNKISLMFFIILLCSCSALKAQWTELLTGTNYSLNTASAVDDNIIWAAGGSGKVIKTINGGVNWADISGNGITINDYPVCMFALDVSNALIGTSDAQLTVPARIFKTTNGGLNWVKTFEQPSGFIDGVYMKNSTEAFFIGDPDCQTCSLTLRKSIDGGTSWAITGSFGTGDYGTNNSIYGINNQIWFGASSFVYYTSDFGVSWSPEFTPISSGVYSIFFENSTTGMCGGTGKINITTNSGTNWTAITFPGTGTINGIAGYGNIWLVSKMGRNVYITTDNGTSWNTDYTIPQTTNRTFMTKSRNGSKLWDVRQDGTVGRRDSPVGIKQLGNNLPVKSMLNGNYPNPFNPETQIKFSVSKTGMVNITVYDINGRKLTLLVSKEFSPGEYEVSFDANEFASGVYYYKMDAGDYSESKKMILLK